MTRERLDEFQFARKIESHLAQNKRGLAESTIRRHLKLSVAECNKALRLIEDSGVGEKIHGRWKLIRNTNVASRPSNVRQGPVAPKPIEAPKGFDLIRRICLFYADALQQMAGNSLEFAPDDSDLLQQVTASIDWFELSRASCTVSRAGLPEQGRNLHNRVTFCGPLEYLPRTSRSHAKEGVWVPVFTLNATVQRHHDSITFARQGHVQVNLKWLERRFSAAEEEYRDDFLIRTGLQSESPDRVLASVSEANFETCWNLLRENVPEFPWADPRSLKDATRERQFSAREDGKIQPVVLCLPEEKVKFQARVIEDLRKIAKASNEELARTALRALVPELIGAEPSDPLASKQIPCVRASALNPQQIRAIHDALNQPLSVVQGPPGTGKSTVVRSTLLSLGVSERTALFASYNHRAVDAVAPILNQWVDGKKLIADLRERADGTDWVQEVVNRSHDKPEKIESTLSEARERLSQLEDRLNEKTAEIAELHERREQLSDIEHRSLLLRTSSGNEWETLAGQIQISESAEQIQRLCKWAQQPWFHPGRWSTVLARRRVFRQIRIQAGIGWKIDVSTFTIFARWKEILHGRQDVEREIRIRPNSAALTSDISALEESLLDASREVARLLAKELPRRLCAVGPEITSLHAESKAKSHVGRRRRKDLIRKNFRKILPGLPLWACTNLSIPRAVPFEAGAFDLAIIDEAGQCDPASVIPVLYRAKRAMIVGDPKQLPPVSKLSREKEDFLRTQHGISDALYNRFGLSQRSAYALAHDALLEAGSRRTMLLEHYRCHPTIANFFSRHFYSDELLIRNPGADTASDKGGIRWTHVPGGSTTVGGSRWHEPQVQAIVKELSRLSENAFDGTIGVVTPFREHAKRIQDYSYRRIPTSQLNRWEFISATADGFQGGEKDIILFGLVGGGDGPQPTPPFYQRQLSRFNVAVSRARTLLHVFGDSDWAAKCEVPVLQDLYRVSQSSVAAPQQEVRTDLIGPVWEPLMAEKLRQAGYSFCQQHQTCGYYLDFALFPDAGLNKSEPRMINIEVDGETYHRDSSGKLREEDVHRDNLLRAHGWTVARFWVYELREDFDGCMKQIQELLK